MEMERTGERHGAYQQLGLAQIGRSDHKTSSDSQRTNARARAGEVA